MAQKKPPKSVLNYIGHLREKLAALKKAYIFGSYVKGSSRTDSDIDIALVFDEVSDSFDLQVELMKIRRQYDSRIEPHVFREIDFKEPNPLAGEILATGIEIH